MTDKRMNERDLPADFICNQRVCVCVCVSLCTIPIYFPLFTRMTFNSAICCSRLQIDAYTRTYRMDFIIVFLSHSFIIYIIICIYLCTFIFAYFGLSCKLFINAISFSLFINCWKHVLSTEWRLCVLCICFTRNIGSCVKWLINICMRL